MGNWNGMMVPTSSTPAGKMEDRQPQSPSWLVSVCLENGTCLTRKIFLNISSRGPLWFAKLKVVRHEFTTVMVWSFERTEWTQSDSNHHRGIFRGCLFFLKITMRSIKRIQLMWILHLAIASAWLLRNWTGTRPWRSAAVMVAILLAFTVKQLTEIWHWLLNEMDFLSGLVFLG